MSSTADGGRGGGRRNDRRDNRREDRRDDRRGDRRDAAKKAPKRSFAAGRRFCHFCETFDPDHYPVNCKEAVCNNCREKGHVMSMCPMPVKCSFCGRDAHPEGYCPLEFSRGRPRKANSTATASGASTSTTQSGAQPRRQFQPAAAPTTSAWQPPQDFPVLGAAPARAPNGAAKRSRLEEIVPPPLSASPSGSISSQVQAVLKMLGDLEQKADGSAFQARREELDRARHQLEEEVNAARAALQQRYEELDEEERSVQFVRQSLPGMLGSDMFARVRSNSGSSTHSTPATTAPVSTAISAASVSASQITAPVPVSETAVSTSVSQTSAPVCVNAAPSSVCQTTASTSSVRMVATVTLPPRSFMAPTSQASQSGPDASEEGLWQEARSHRQVVGRAPGGGGSGASRSATTSSAASSAVSPFASVNWYDALSLPEEDALLADADAAVDAPVLEQEEERMDCNDHQPSGSGSGWSQLWLWSHRHRWDDGLADRRLPSAQYSGEGRLFIIVNRFNLFGSLRLYRLYVCLPAELMMSWELSPLSETNTACCLCIVPAVVLYIYGCYRPGSAAVRTTL